MYLRLLLSLSLLLLINAEELAKREVKTRSKRLIGGTYVGNLPPPEYDFYVVILNKRLNAQNQLESYHEANGVVYDSEYIITVAHALGPLTLNREIHCGNNVRKVVKVIKHPGFDGGSQSPILPGDLAILKLDSPLDSSCRQATFPTVPLYSWTVVVPGWGNVWWSSYVKFVEVELTVLTNTQCNLVYGSYVDTNTMVCAWDSVQALCQGDAGSPAMVGNTVVGLGSWTDNNCQLPAVFTRLSVYMDWIRSTIAADKLPSDPGNEPTVAPV